MVETVVRYVSLFRQILACNSQTDAQTDRHAKTAKTALTHIASRG